MSSVLTGPVGADTVLWELGKNTDLVLVLPEGNEHHNGCDEGDERGGIPHCVHLPERGEVACLGSRKPQRRAKQNHHF